MILSIHQPAYLPWMGYFDRLRHADVFVYLDSVQFQKGSFQNRNKIRTKDGWTWLTVPIMTKGSLYQTKLVEVEINNQPNWRWKHRETIRQNYTRSIEFARIMPILESFYAREWSKLSELCYEMMLQFNKLLEIDVRIIRSSELRDLKGNKNDLILNLCKLLGADIYLSGSQGRNYLRLDTFDAEGIEVLFQDYIHPSYHQIYPNFVFGMGIVDLLMNENQPGHFFRS